MWLRLTLTLTLTLRQASDEGRGPLLDAEEKIVKCLGCDYLETTSTATEQQQHFMFCKKKGMSHDYNSGPGPGPNPSPEPEPEPNPNPNQAARRSPASSAIRPASRRRRPRRGSLPRPCSTSPSRSGSRTTWVAQPSMRAPAKLLRSSRPPWSRGWAARARTRSAAGAAPRTTRART